MLLMCLSIEFVIIWVFTGMLAFSHIHAFHRDNKSCNRWSNIPFHCLLPLDSFIPLTPGRPLLFTKALLELHIIHFWSHQRTSHCVIQNSFDPAGDAQNMQYMTKCIGKHLVEFDIRWKLASSCERLWLMLRGNCAFIFYIVVKLLYLVNCLRQLIIINLFLGGGVSVLQRLAYVLRRYEHAESSAYRYLLPRNILCEIDIGHPRNVRYTMNCSLPLNFWYEIVFLFLWFWLVFVTTATLWSLACFVDSMLNMFYQER